MSQPQIQPHVRSAFDSLEFTSRPISKHPVVAAIADTKTDSETPMRRCWVGWGRKRSGQVAQQKARASNDNFLLLEDGFIRSIERTDPPLSLMMDDIGIYYDAGNPSRLEQLISESLNRDEIDRANTIIRCWKDNRVSKYNASPEYRGQLPNNYVLVIDQVAGDSSIQFGLADSNSFQQALDTALQEHPDAQVLVKVHPDAFARSKYGNFDLNEIQNHPRIQVINEPCHPIELIQRSDQVYVVTSQIGFEALIWGKKVTCFGTPFYSGWGLTDDRGPPPACHRPNTVTIQQLVLAALVKYGLYSHPETGKICEVEEVIKWVGLQRQMRSRFSEVNAPMHVIGFSRWKKPFVQQFLKGSSIAFSRKKEKCPTNSVAVLWGSKAAPSDCGGIIRIEDGFLRSSGLGADLVRPLSWVIDDQGIYYDATRPSRLEHILSQYQWSETELRRAEKLRITIVESKLSKYNLSGKKWMPSRTDKRILLVPGQVPSDASIKLGCQKIRTNLDLLKIVRCENPDSHIVYKPHPDIVAGLRRTDSDWKVIETLCDEVVLDADGMQMLEQVDEVHTMTSLMGFEALIRNKNVYCYGQPFYSGWGLTNDLSINSRRNRKLTIDQLCAGVLVNYPTYISRDSKMYTTPERTIEELCDWKNSGSSTMPMWRKALRAILRLGKH